MLGLICGARDADGLLVKTDIAAPPPPPPLLLLLLLLLPPPLLPDPVTVNGVNVIVIELPAESETTMLQLYIVCGFSELKVMFVFMFAGIVEVVETHAPI